MSVGVSINRMSDVDETLRLRLKAVVKVSEEVNRKSHPGNTTVQLSDFSTPTQIATLKAYTSSQTDDRIMSIADHTACKSSVVRSAKN